MKFQRKHLPTLRIDPDKPVFFEYGRQVFHAYDGDTVATGLFANGIRVFSRDGKGISALDSRPDGIFLEIDETANMPAETTMIRQSMRVRPVKGASRGKWGLIGSIGHFGKNLMDGPIRRFCYKYPGLWQQLAPRWRQQSGLGRIEPEFRMPGHYTAIFPDTDVCVIGAGIAGMEAALTAARLGLRVILLESRPWLGGWFDYRVQTGGTRQVPYVQVRNLEKAVLTTEAIRTYCRTTAIGVYPGPKIIGFQTGTADDPFDQRYMAIAARVAIVATGCVEMPLEFENNHRSGVMDVDCALRLARTWGILPGHAAVLSIGHDSGIEAAIDLARLGMNVRAVADRRPSGQNPESIAGLAKWYIRLFRGWQVRNTIGNPEVRSVEIHAIDGSETRHIECDTLVASAGPVPADGLFTTTGEDDPVYTAGRIRGIQHLEAIAVSGQIAGLQAASHWDMDTQSRIRELEEPLRTLVDESGPEITFRRSGVPSQHVFQVPGLMATFARSCRDSLKRSPIHSLLVSSGAVMTPMGDRVVATRFSNDPQVRDEVFNVRTNVGIMDLSHSEKFRIQGPGALQVLQQVFKGHAAVPEKFQAAFFRLHDLHGCLEDICMVARTGDEQFYVSTSGLGTCRLVQVFDAAMDGNGQCHGKDLTHGLAVILLAGPRCREVLGKLTAMDLSSAAFPLMAVRQLQLRDIESVMAVRNGVTGELGYEFHIPASHMANAWKLILEMGAPYHIRPFGLDALIHLCLEKGDADRIGVSRKFAVSGWQGKRPVGFVLADASQSVPDEGDIVVDTEIRGYIAMVRYSDAMQSVVGMAWLDPELTRPGTPLTIYRHGSSGTQIRAIVVDTPFYDPDGQRIIG